ncbi:MAG TPA: DUF1598 domain-containing protein [Lacipirellulaceae bacterium]|nr:DUF1598 domain-containing protein [Lacipirellulaceae bacterium]
MRTSLFATRRWIVNCFLVISLATPTLGQQPNQPAAQNGGRNFQNAAIIPGGQNGFLFGGGGNLNNGNNGNGNGNGNGLRGAAANADFDSLIDLIQSTVATDTWSDNGGGKAEIRPFPGGVLVDAAGLLRLKPLARGGAAASELTGKRGQAPTRLFDEPRSATKASELRYVSLPRLDREIARRQAAHERLDPAMLTLAGLERVEYVFVYPETGDLVIAGPASGWYVNDDGRILSKTTNQPVVRLDDLLTLLRRGADAANSHFGCSINPRQQSLANTQAFLAASSKKPLEPSQRKQWLSDLRDTVGKQDIEIFGVDSASRLAEVLVEADYHMKLIGMGLAEGVDGVESYLNSIHLRAGEQPPAMSVLRWWFTLNYDGIARSDANDAYELVGQGVRVLSENEMLAQQGQRVHTGQSDPLNRQFAESFTAHFDELAKKYPVYGELRNIFDLAMVAAIVQKDGLAEKVHWTPAVLMKSEKLRLPQGNVPREVETVINHRVVNQRTILAGVSGGVMVAPSDVLASVAKTDSAGTTVERAAPAPKDLGAEAWWWDGAEAAPK